MDGKPVRLKPRSSAARQLYPNRGAKGGPGARRLSQKGYESQNGGGVYVPKPQGLTWKLQARYAFQRFLLQGFNKQTVEIAGCGKTSAVQHLVRLGPKEQIA